MNNTFETKTQSEAEDLLKTVRRSAEMKRVQCVLFRCFGLDSASISRMVGYKPAHVRLVWQWYKEKGWDRLLGERRGQNRGKAHLKLKEEADFLESFKVRAEKGSLVTGKEIHQAHKKLLNKDLDPTLTYRLLHRQGWRKIVPRPEHPKHDPEKMKDFRGVVFPLTMIRMRIEVVLEKMPFRVMFQDEARFGRIDDPGACWAQAGVRPVTHKQIIREYTYLYGAFSPQDGVMDSLILPYMDSFCMNRFLEEVSARHPKELILMVTDGAPCHKGGELVVPENMRLLFLPPYSPQLNPAENMWDEMREKFFGNVSFSSMDELEEHLVSASVHYENSPDIVKSISSWEWMGLDFV